MSKDTRHGRSLRETRGNRGADRQPEVSRAQQVRAALDELAKPKRGQRFVDTQRLIIRYAIERFISRLSQSPLRDAFVLKGAMATAIYVPNGFRTTRDADFQAHGQYDAAALKECLRDVCKIAADDGVVFSPEEMVLLDAGADRGYTGFNVIIPTKLGTSKCNVELDICFGEIVTPPAQEIDYPVLLDMEKPRIRVYPLETIIAEKFQIIVDLAESNSRLKDYFDLAGIADSCVVNGATLKGAIKATFDHRGTTIPSEVPTGLTADYYDSRRSTREWENWLRSQPLPNRTNLQVCCEKIIAMLMPAAVAASTEQAFLTVWRDGQWIYKEPDPSSLGNGESATER